jgi:tripartite-type tricarboxylate transporter receptor subunit TctC
VVIAKINDAVSRALSDPDIRQKLLSSGAVPAPTSPQEFGKLLRDEIERWGKVIREQGIKEGT